MLRYLRLARQFDPARLLHDLARLEADHWQAHYNTRDYEGGWSTLQLRAVGGDPANNSAAQSPGPAGPNPYRDTPLLARAPYLREVLDGFAFEKTAVRLMKLAAGARIKPHHDHDLCFEDGLVRLHIPIRTHPELEFTLEDERLPMPAGSCWYLNLTLRHAVHNPGPTDRVHLVVDGLVNDWVRAWFARPEHQRVEMEAPRPAPPPPAVQRQIIAELRRQHTPAARQLADELEAALPPQ